MKMRPRFSLVTLSLVLLPTAFAQSPRTGPTTYTTVTDTTETTTRDPNGLLKEIKRTTVTKVSHTEKVDETWTPNELGLLHLSRRVTTVTDTLGNKTVTVETFIDDIGRLVVTKRESTEKGNAGTFVTTIEERDPDSGGLEVTGRETVEFDALGRRIQTDERINDLGEMVIRKRVIRSN